MKALIAIAAGLMVATVALAAETEVKLVDPAKVFPYLDKYYSLAPPERSLFGLAYRLRQDNGAPPADVRLTLVDGARRTPLPVAADGRVERLPSAQEFAGKPQIEVVRPKGAKLGQTFTMEALIRPATEIDPAQCVQAIAQTNAAIGRFAGVMAFAAPKIRSCQFVGVASGVAVGADGTTTPLPVEKGRAVFRPATMKPARTLRLPNPPRMVTLGD